MEGPSSGRRPRISFLRRTGGEEMGALGQLYGCIELGLGGLGLGWCMHAYW